MNDPFFRVELIAATPNPQQCVYAAMHQDYSEGFVVADRADWPDETTAGRIAVKRLLAGDRGHYGCYSSDTEVLTSEGWKLWPDVTSSHRLAAVDIATGQIVFECPRYLQKVPIADGDKLYYIETRKLNLKVTLDHRMVVSFRGKKGYSPWEFKTAESIVGKAVRYMTGGTLADEQRGIPKDVPAGVNISSLLRLAGFFYGDGLRTNNKKPRCLRFRLRRARKIAYLSSLGFDLDVRTADRYVIREKEVALWIHKHFSSAEGKQLPEWIISLPSQLLDCLLDGLKSSDGTLKGKGWGLDSTAKGSLDVLQAACAVNNIPASLSLNNRNSGVGHENHKPCWRLHLSGARDCTARQEVHQKGRTKGIEALVQYGGYVYCATVSTGALLVRRNNKPVVSGNCTEHPQITFNVGWFPHSVMQQARTHRVGVSFDVQSGRYTGQRICQAAEYKLNPEEVFYLRPVGAYSDRQGKRYQYTEQARSLDMGHCLIAATRYKELLDQGFAEEHARSILPFDIRQHFVVSFSLRALLHFMDLRAKLDAQEEIRALCELMWPHMQTWAPEIAAWYEKHRLHKARLAP